MPHAQGAQMSFFFIATQTTIQPLTTVAAVQSVSVGTSLWVWHGSRQVGKTRIASLSRERRGKKRLLLVPRNNEELANLLSDLYMSAT